MTTLARLQTTRRLEFWIDLLVTDLTPFMGYSSQRRLRDGRFLTVRRMALPAWSGHTIWFVTVVARLTFDANAAVGDRRIVSAVGEVQWACFRRDLAQENRVQRSARWGGSSPMEPTCDSCAEKYSEAR